MWPLIFLLLMGGGALGAHVWTHANWKRAAEKLGLTFHEGGFWSGWEIYGDIRGCAVKVENLKSRLRRNGRYTRITVTGARAISTRLDLRAESLLTAAKKVVTGQDVLIGEPEFDAKVHVKGPDHAVFSVLDARSRMTVQRFLTRWRGEVSGGMVLRESGRVMRRRTALEAVILDMVRVAESVQTPEAGIYPALLENLRRDPVGEVRRSCLEALLVRGGAHVEAATAVGMMDADPQIRLVAAQAAGSAGEATLRGLLDGPHGSAALESLVKIGVSDAESLVRAAVEGPPGPRTPMALRLVPSLGLVDLHPRLERLAEHPNGEIAGAVAAALSGLDDPVAEAGLLRLLAHPDDDARAAAAEGLGAVGSLAAVRALVPLAERGPRARRDAARDAIKRIQARHAKAGAGGLALARETAGALAVAGERGGLSPAKEAE